jgi:S1-C subfamily serine protease
VGAGGQQSLGDVIMEIEGRRVRDYDDLYNSLDRHAPGDTVTFTVSRQAETKEVRIELVAL